MGRRFHGSRRRGCGGGASGACASWEAAGEVGDAIEGEGGEAAGGGELGFGAEVELDGAAVGGVGVGAGFAGGEGGGFLLAGEADVEEGGAMEVEELTAAGAEGALAHHVALGFFDAGEGEELVEEGFGGGHGVSVRRVSRDAGAMGGRGFG